MVYFPASFPREIIHQILRELSPIDLMACRLACKTLKEEASNPSLWKKLLEDSFPKRFKRLIESDQPDFLHNYLGASNLVTRYYEKAFIHEDLTKILGLRFPIQMMQRNGAYLATLGWSAARIEVFDFEQRQAFYTIKNDKVITTFYLKENCLVYGDNMGKIPLFDLSQQKTLGLFREGKFYNSLEALQFDERFLIAGSRNDLLQLWEFPTKKYLGGFCASPIEVYFLQFNATTVYAASRRGVSFLDLETRKSEAYISVNMLNCLQLEGEEVYCGLSYGGVTVLDSRCGVHVATFGQTTNIAIEALWIAENFFVAGCNDGTLQIWDKRTSSCVREEKVPVQIRSMVCDREQILVAGYSSDDVVGWSAGLLATLKF